MLVALLLIAIIWVAEGVKTGTGQAVYILEKLGMKSPEDLHWFLVQTVVVTAVVLLVFLILVYKSRKNTRILLTWKHQAKTESENIRLFCWIESSIILAYKAIYTRLSVLRRK